MKDTLSESEVMELMGIYLHGRKLERELTRIEKRIIEIFNDDENTFGPTNWLREMMWKDDEMTLKEFKKFLKNKCEVKTIIDWVPLRKKFVKEFPKKLQYKQDYSVKSIKEK